MTICKKKRGSALQALACHKNAIKGEMESNDSQIGSLGSLETASDFFEDIFTSNRYSGGSMSVPITKFSLRMYGSQKAVEQERKRQEKAGFFVIHPYSNFRFYWDFVTLILLIISMLIIPIAITFFNEKMTTDTGWITVNLCMDFWFLADIVMNFHTGLIVESGDCEVILDLTVIRSRYLRSWFAIDLISTLPVDYILQLTSGGSAGASASRAMKLFRFAKIISLLRLLRISRLIRYVHQWEQIVGMQYDLAVAAVRIFNLVCLMLLIGHWNGCLQFLIPMLYDFPEHSWIVEDGLRTKPWPEQYSWCMFKAMSHMLCIGYGQKPPVNLMDLWMTMLSMVSGAVCFAMFIGHATALIQSMDSSKRQYKEKYMQVKEYMRFRRLPKAMRARVYGYYENRFQGKMFDEQGILSELSTNLREEIVNYNCRHLVASVPFFKNAEPDFVTDVVQKLKYEFFQPKDTIVREGEVGKKMYFIQHGLVEVRNSQRKEPIKQLSDGSYFGEICLLINDRRVASVNAVSFCSTYSLHVDDFNDILTNNPVMRQTLERVAAARLSSLGQHSRVLDERVKESNDLYSESNEIVEEIVKHDKRPASVVSNVAVGSRRQYYAERIARESLIKKSKSVGADINVSTSSTPSSHRKSSFLFKHFEKPQLFQTEEHSEEGTPTRKRLSFCSHSLSGADRPSKKLLPSGMIQSIGKPFVNLAKRRGRKKFSAKKQNSLEIESSDFSVDVQTEETIMSNGTNLQQQTEEIDCNSKKNNTSGQAERSIPTVVVVDVEPILTDNGATPVCDVEQCDKFEVNQEMPVKDRDKRPPKETSQQRSKSTKIA